MIRDYDIFQEYKPQQTYETLICYEIPSPLWQNLGTDLFHWIGSEYLIIVLYNTNNPFVRKLVNSYSNCDVQPFSQVHVPEK